MTALNDQPMPSKGITAADLNYWDADQYDSVTFAGSIDGSRPVATIRTFDESGRVVYRVPFQPSEADREAIAAGAVVWLSLWGQMVPHQVESGVPDDR